MSLWIWLCLPLNWQCESGTCSFYWQGYTATWCSVFPRQTPTWSQVFPNRPMMHRYTPGCPLWISNPTPSLTTGSKWCWQNPSSQQGYHLNRVLSVFSLPQGPVASTASALSVLSVGPGLPPPPPPPGPPPPFDSEGRREESSPSRSALFAQLNQGEAITRGEKTRPWGCLPLASGTQIPQSPRWWIHHSIPVPTTWRAVCSSSQGRWAQWAVGWIRKKNSEILGSKWTTALYHHFSPWCFSTSYNQGIKIKWNKNDK